MVAYLPVLSAYTAWAMRRLTAADYRRMPWRNGGGTTTEILVEPRDNAIAGDRFHYRLSIADVASDGPFSRFDGYDRHIMLLSGAGMTLACGAHGRIELLAPFEPRSFSGDWEVRGSLVAGPVRDFNLIVDRARASSSLGVRLLDARETLAFEPGTVSIVHVIEGALIGADECDTIVADAPFESRAPRHRARGGRSHCFSRPIKGPHADDRPPPSTPRSYERRQTNEPKQITRRHRAAAREIAAAAVSLSRVVVSRVRTRPGRATRATTVSRRAA